MLVCKNIIDTQQETLKRIQSKMYYLEIALLYNDMIPLPWEIEDFDEKLAETRTFERDGNVVYLTQENE